MNDNNSKIIVRFFEEVEKSWAFHDVNIGLVIGELFADRITKKDTIFGIGSSDIMEECQKYYEIILESPKSFEEGIHIMEKLAPESAKIVIWIHRRNSRKG